MEWESKAPILAEKCQSKIYSPAMFTFIGLSRLYFWSLNLKSLGFKLEDIDVKPLQIRLHFQSFIQTAIVVILRTGLKRMIQMTEYGFKHGAMEKSTI